MCPYISPMLMISLSLSSQVTLSHCLPRAPLLTLGQGLANISSMGRSVQVYHQRAEHSVQLTALTYILSTAQCVTRTLITLITLPSSQYTRVTNSPSVPPPSSLAVLTLWTTLAHCWAMYLSPLFTLLALTPDSSASSSPRSQAPLVQVLAVAGSELTTQDSGVTRDNDEDGHQECLLRLSD